MITQLAIGIAQALPTLLPTIVNVVITVVETLIDNVDMLVDAAIAIMVALAEGIVNAIPTLIEKAPEIIGKLVSALIRNFPKILEAGVELIGYLIMGIAQCFISLGNIGKKLIGKIKDGIDGAGDAKTWGKDLMDNFISGITDKIKALKDKVTEVADTVKDFLGFSEPKKGPLSNFHTYAPDMMDLFAKGIKENEDVVTSQIAKSFDFGDFTTAPTAMFENTNPFATTESRDTDLVSAIREALDSYSIDWNDRNLGRLVRKYA